MQANETKKKVEQEIVRYREVKQNCELKEIMNRDTKDFVEFKGVQYEDKMYVRLMEHLINQLTDEQQGLIYGKYIEDNGKNQDLHVQESLNLTARTYYRKKLSTLLTLGEKLEVI